MQLRRRIALAGVVILLVVAWAIQVLSVWSVPDADLQDPWADATTYLAAGERLNADRELYQLQAGDRPVLILPTFDAPLLSPPPIAVLWRPLAIHPVGMVLWVAGCWASVLSAVTYLILKGGLRAAVICAALSWPLGEMLAAANVSAYFFAAYIAIWRRPASAKTASLLGAMAALKLAPIALGGFLVGMGGWRSAAAAAVGLTAMSVLGVLGAGFGSYVAYLDVAGSTLPSDLSVAGRLGVRWLPFAGIPAACLIGFLLRRAPARSFLASYGIMLMATPAIYVADFALLALLILPLISPHPRGGLRPTSHPAPAHGGGARARDGHQCGE